MTKQLDQNSSMIDVLKEVEDLLGLYENLEDVAGYRFNSSQHGDRMDRIEQCKRVVQFKLDELTTYEHDTKAEMRKQS